MSSTTGSISRVVEPFLKDYLNNFIYKAKC